MTRPELLAVIRDVAEDIEQAFAQQPIGAPLKFDITLEQGHLNARGARRHDGSVRIEVFGHDEIPLDNAAFFDLPLLPAAAPAPAPASAPPPAPAPAPEAEAEEIQGRNGVVWRPAPGGLQTEVIGIDDAGDFVTRRVNTDRYKWQMTCACGNVRYGLKSAIHQVEACRACAAEARHAYQVEWQRAKRESSSSTPKKASSKADEPEPSPQD